MIANWPYTATAGLHPIKRVVRGKGPVISAAGEKAGDGGAARGAVAGVLGDVA